MIKGMNHITLAVTDIDRAFTFYRDILGLKPLVKWDKGAYFLVGDFWFCLNLDQDHIPTTCYTHYAFSVDQKDFELISQKIINSGAQIFKENTSAGDSLYFLDPDGHKLEIHTQDWQDRIKAKKENSGAWQKIEWFV